MNSMPTTIYNENYKYSIKQRIVRREKKYYFKQHKIKTQQQAQISKQRNS